MSSAGRPGHCACRESHSVAASSTVCGVGGPAGSRRLRQVRWKEWKSTAARRHHLRVRGISELNARKWADSSKGYWRVAGSGVLQVSLPDAYWNRLGLLPLTQTWQRLNPTA